MIPILVERIRYWQGARIDTGRAPRYWKKSGFDTGRGLNSILVGIAALLFASLACSISAPGWVPPADPTPAAVSSPVPSQTPAKPQVESSGTPEPSRAAVSAMRSLNVRMGPSYSSAGVGWLYHGEEVELTRRCSGAWAEIIFKGSRRWVRGRYITGDTCEAE